MSKLRLVDYVTSDESASVTGDETPRAKVGRPRKYATRAERQSAYRARNSMHEIRFEPADSAWLKRTAVAVDLSVAELVNQMIKFAKSNRDWRAQPMFGKPLPNAAVKQKSKT